MNFKIWVENEASMGSGTPEMMPPMANKGGDTPASDEVKRTSLQPQVDSQEIDTKSKREQDRILAIDSDIEHMDMNLPGGDDADTPKINKFKAMWDELKSQWDTIKMSDEVEGQDEGGLGDEEDEEYSDMMRQHPNMAHAPGTQGPHGPGIFGQQ